jgi:hypothetical protein
MEFDKALEIEYLGYKSLYTEKPSFFGRERTSMEIVKSRINKLWKNAGGTTEDQLLDFLGSKSYKCIPYTNISCNLYAKILIKEKKLGTGDIPDICHLSSMIPLCDLLVTDREMKNIVRNLGLDKKYRTKVFCLKEFDDLMTEIEKL